MDTLFFQVINRSITSCYVIGFVIIVRLLLKKFPKNFSYALWSVVLFRLVCPFSFEGLFTLIPVNTQAVKEGIIYSKNPQINTNIPIVDHAVNQSLPVPLNPIASINPVQIWIFIGQLIWIIGVALLISYSLFTAIKLYRKLKHAQLISENIYVMQGLNTSFVFGILKPKIYLSNRLSEKEQEYILLHEQKHIKRLDHIIKPFAFLAVCIYWFNPLVWMAFFLMSEDMELSCDESVIKTLGSGIKKDYAMCLLSLSSGRITLGGCPLAFGENNIKSRIKNILNYKKPSLWITVVIGILLIFIGIGLIVNPTETVPLEQVDVSDSIEVEATPIGQFSVDLLNNGLPVKTLAMDTIGLQQLLQDIQMDALVKSAAFEGADITTLPVSYRITWTISEEQPTKYYAYVLSKEDRPVLQSGEQGYYSYLSSHLFTQLQDLFFKPEVIIDALFEKLMSQPPESSNPHDYIKANQAVFDEIIAYGDSALVYCFSRFEKGGQTDLKGQLMMKVCQALSDFPQKDLAYANGQVWYDAFKEKLFSDKDSDYVEKYFHASYVLIHYLNQSGEDRAEIRLPDFTYTGNDPILKLVYATALSQHTGYRQENAFLVPAVHLHAHYEEQNKLKVFATIYNGLYTLYGDQVNSVGGSIIPMAITYAKDEKGHYVFEEAVQSNDGSYFASSIKAYCTYPVSGKEIPGLAEQILEHYSNYEDLEQLQKDNLTEHLKAYHQNGDF